MPKLNLTDADTQLPFLNTWARGVDNTLDQLSASVNHVAGGIDAIQTTLGSAVELAPDVSSASLVQSSTTIFGIVYSKLTVTYTAPSPLGTFAGVFLVISNYHGSAELVKVSEDTFTGHAGSSKSFVTVLERTGELVTLYLVAKNANEGAEANWSLAPSLSVTLDAGGAVGTLDTNGQITGTFKTPPVNTNGFTTTNGILTQSGTTTLINVAASTCQWGDGQVVYNSGSVNPGSYGTFYIYADDPHFAGGAVTYIATTTTYTLTASNSRVYFGKIITVVGGGGASGGGGGGCPIEGTDISFFPGSIGTTRLVPASEWVTIFLEDGRTLTAIPEHPVYSDSRGRVPMESLSTDDSLLTNSGVLRVVSVARSSSPKHKLFISMPEGHLYWANGILSHNKIDIG